MEYFNSELWDVEHIAAELYDFKKIGGMSLPSFLKEEVRYAALQEITLCHYLFRRSPELYGKSRQNLSSLYFGEADETWAIGNLENVHFLSNICNAYAVQYAQLSHYAHFQAGKPNSIGIHKYPVGEYGIDAHVDHSWYANLVSILVLQGKGKLCILKEREQDNLQENQRDNVKDNGSEEIELASTPGTLILLRGPRIAEEKIHRPRHSISKITEERIALIMRQDLRKREGMGHDEHY